jgi:pyruvate dehydrogenase (quinone)/pyruvate oxidase
VRQRHGGNVVGQADPRAPGQMFSLSGMLASMANGLPYAIAAQVAYPDRQVVAFVGDGAFSMLMAEFAQCVKYKLPVKVVIVKNNSLGMIKWEQWFSSGIPSKGASYSPSTSRRLPWRAAGPG